MELYLHLLSYTIIYTYSHPHWHVGPACVCTSVICSSSIWSLLFLLLILYKTSCLLSGLCMPSGASTIPPPSFLPASNLPASLCALLLFVHLLSAHHVFQLNSTISQAWFSYVKDVYLFITTQTLPISHPHICDTLHLYYMYSL